MEILHYWRTGQASNLRRSLGVHVAYHARSRATPNSDLICVSRLRVRQGVFNVLATQMPMGSQDVKYAGRVTHSYQTASASLLSMEDFSTKHFIVFDFAPLNRSNSMVAFGLASGINFDGEPWSQPVLISNVILGESLVRAALAKLQGRTITKDTWAQVLSDLEANYRADALDGEFKDVFGHKTFKASEMQGLLRPKRHRLFH